MSSWETLLKSAEPHSHFVHFDRDEEVLAVNVGNYLWEGLKRGDGLLVVATAQHRELFSRRLSELGAGREEAVRRRQLVFLDGFETLASLMRDGQPDWELFQSTVGSAMESVRPREGHRGLRAYGEMVGILWTQGELAAAIRLEQYWNKLLRSMAFSLFCFYPIDVFGKDFQPAALDAVFCEHTHLVPAGKVGHLEAAINRAMEDVLGPRVDDVRSLIRANFRPAWAAIPAGESIVLWLRNNLGAQAEEILDLARQYYKKPVSAAH
jgi:hypothetical protein